MDDIIKELIEEGPKKVIQLWNNFVCWIGLSSNRVVLISHSLDWAEIEALYGTYLRPTKH